MLAGSFKPYHHRDLRERHGRGRPHYCKAYVGIEGIMPRIPCNAIDRHIGLRVRQRRMAVSMTQMSLADALDVSFQQIQKYETGKNKISASRLFEIAYHLCVPFEYFFNGLDDPRRCEILHNSSRCACSYVWVNMASWKQ